MEEDRGNDGDFRQNLLGGISHLRHTSQQQQQLPVAMVPVDEKEKEPAALKEYPPPPTLQIPLNQQQPQSDVRAVAHDKILFQERNHYQQQQQQEVPNPAVQEPQKQAEGALIDASITSPTVVGGNEGLSGSVSQDITQKEIGKAAVDSTEQATKKTEQPELAAKTSIGVSQIAPQTIGTKTNNPITTNLEGETNQPSAIQPPAEPTTTIATGKKATKRPRAKPGFGLRTSRTTIVETGQKRRSCICTNSKLCNELMTKWAKVSPPDYHYVQLPREHNPTSSSSDHPSVVTESQNTGVNVPGKSNNTTMSGQGESSHSNDNNTNMSDTDIYKNGFRYATLRNIQAKNPLPKDERVALCHYHPEVRPYLFWPKNTPSAQKYAIPLSLAVQLGYDTVANKCQGFNTEKYCYAVPTYSFEDAKKEIGSVEAAFYERVRQIKTNPTQFVRDLRQCEEELKEVHKLRRRNAELLRRLDDRRRSIKRLKSVLKVQRHATKEAQQQQLVAHAVSANAQAHAVANSSAVQQQYQQHAYQTSNAFHQQQLVDPSQSQQQTTAIPQPLGQQNHTQFFQPPPPTQEQQAIGIVVGGLAQNSEHQQHEQQHHWTYTQYTNAGVSGTENEQQHSQQQAQLAAMHAYDSAAQHQQHQHDQQQQHQQQQPVPSPMDDHNNTGTNFSYAQQLEAAMAAAVAAGFKDDQEDVDQHHQHHGDLVGDVVDHLEELDHHDGFGGEHGDDDDLEDDEWSDTEQYRQSTGGGGVSQNHQRPRKWPRKTVVLPPVSSEMEEIPKKAKRKNKVMSGNNKKKAKVTKAITANPKKSDDVSAPMVQKDQLPSSSMEGNKIRKV